MWKNPFEGDRVAMPSEKSPSQTDGATFEDGRENGVSVKTAWMGAVHPCECYFGRDDENGHAQGGG